MAICRQVFNNVLKWQCMLNVIETVHEVEPLETFQIAVRLSHIEGMGRSKFADYRYDISDFVFNI